MSGAPRRGCSSWAFMRREPKAFLVIQCRHLDQSRAKRARAVGTLHTRAQSAMRGWGCWNGSVDGTPVGRKCSPDIQRHVCLDTTKRGSKYRPGRLQTLSGITQSWNDTLTMTPANISILVSALPLANVVNLRAHENNIGWQASPNTQEQCIARPREEPKWPLVGSPT